MGIVYLEVYTRLLQLWLFRIIHNRILIIRGNMTEFAVEELGVYRHNVEVTDISEVFSFSLKARSLNQRLIQFVNLWLKELRTSLFLINIFWICSFSTISEHQSTRTSIIIIIFRCDALSSDWKFTYVCFQHCRPKITQAETLVPFLFDHENGSSICL